MASNLHPTLQTPLLLLLAFVLLPTTSHGDHVNVVLLGATGDLARRRLWPGLFSVYCELSAPPRSPFTFSFFGASRKGGAESEARLFRVVREGGLQCPPEIGARKPLCQLLREQFMRLVRSVRLHLPQDYIDLCSNMGTEVAQEGLVEAGRLFYLSVPPTAYADIVSNISSACRPPHGAWMRVAFEKPFGWDARSAAELNSQLSLLLSPEEMCRIDHYLAKQAVQEILPFRMRNREVLDPLWNRLDVERVEIALKEKQGAKGRIDFFDDYGIIRDIMQNHLTEIMSLVAMDTPFNLSNRDEVERNKMVVLTHVHPLCPWTAVIGQYDTYFQEVLEEMKRPALNGSLTSTFAAVAIYFSTSRWEGVPFLLMSGKSLSECASYIRVIFRHSTSTLQPTTSSTAHNSSFHRQLIFIIGHDSLYSPAILISRGLLTKVRPGPNWEELLDVETLSTGDEGLHIFGSPLIDYQVLVPRTTRDAYSTILSGLLGGLSGMCVREETLDAAWKMWSPLLKSLTQRSPRLYPHGDPNSTLDFEIVHGGLKFKLPEKKPLVHFIQNDDHLQPVSAYNIMENSTLFGDPLVALPAEDLLSALVLYIQKSANDAVARSGEFHIALPGGHTSLALFRALASARYATTLPWERMHVWQTDERCGGASQDGDDIEIPGSNFALLRKILLQHVIISPSQLHPIPADNQHCGPTEALDYAAELISTVHEGRLDLVVLGLGKDGHVASLFPGDSTALSAVDPVISITMPRRISLSVTSLRRARSVAVVVTGQSKRKVLESMILAAIGERSKRHGQESEKEEEEEVRRGAVEQSNVQDTNVRQGATNTMEGESLEEKERGSGIFAGSHTKDKNIRKVKGEKKREGRGALFWLNPLQWPLSAAHPENGSLKWFVDLEALPHLRTWRDHGL
uniref:GDH/6PGL endoplasmic bifunctional protein-like n=1 Tax=Myxine glutinosa TaxID=7769 RepID=UPI00358E6DE0